MDRKRNLLERKEESFWNEKITSNAGNSKKLWSVLNNLQRKDRAIPPSTSDISAETLSGFFQDKVRAVRDDTSTADAPTFTKLTDASFTSFQSCFIIIIIIIIINAQYLIHQTSDSVTCPNHRRGGGSKIPRSVSAEVLFTGPHAHFHLTGVPR